MSNSWGMRADVPCTCRSVIRYSVMYRSVTVLSSTFYSDIFY